MPFFYELVFSNELLRRMPDISDAVYRFFADVYRQVVLIRHCILGFVSEHDSYFVKYITVIFRFAANGDEHCDRIFKSLLSPNPVIIVAGEGTRQAVLFSKMDDGTGLSVILDIDGRILLFIVRKGMKYR